MRTLHVVPSLSGQGMAFLHVVPSLLGHAPLGHSYLAIHNQVFMFPANYLETAAECHVLNKLDTSTNVNYCL